MDESSTAVNDTVVADATTTDSAPVENNSSEVAEDEFDGLGDVDLSNTSAARKETESQTEEKSTDDSKEVADETDTEAQPQGENKSLSPKSENRFQQLANDNRALRDEIARLTAQEAQFAQEQDLLNETDEYGNPVYSAQEVERIAFQQSREQQAQAIAEQRYHLEVQQNQQLLSSEAERAIREFPMFDENSKEYDPEIASKVDEILGANLLRDPNTNQIVGSNVSPYQLYQTVAATYQTAAQKAQAEAQKATQKMMANADVSGSAADKSSGNTEDDIFDRIKDIRFA